MVPCWAGESQRVRRNHLCLQIAAPYGGCFCERPKTKRSPRKMPDSVLEGTRLCDSGRSRANWMILGPREGNLGMKLLDRANSVATLPLNSQAAKCPFHAKEAAHDARSN